jgi:PhnB protein
MTDQPSTAGLSPYLTVSDGAGAIDFYKQIFGARESARHLAQDGKRIMHAALAINGGTLMLSDEFPEMGSCAASAPKLDGPTPVAVSLLLGTPAEVDATFAKALAAGATQEMEPADAFWGARFAMFRDPFGHRWMLNAPL